MGADQALATGKAIEAEVIEELPNGVYRVEIQKKHLVLAHPSSEQVKNFVRLLPGDRVEIVLATHDPGRGRITRKL